MQEVFAKRRILGEAGVVSEEVLDAQGIAEAEPFLRKGLAGGLLVPDDGVIYPPVAASFSGRGTAQGAVLVRGRGCRFSGTWPCCTGGLILARRRACALASGAEISLLPFLPIQKRKGHLLITDRYPDMVRHQLAELGYLKSARIPLRIDSVCVQHRLTKFPEPTSFRLPRE